MKLLRRKDPMREPIIPWHFRDTVTGFDFSEKYESKAALMDHIARYREMNGQEAIRYLDEIVEDFICRQPGMDMYSEEYEFMQASHRTLEQYINGATAFIKTIKRRFTKEEAMVTQEVANSRALTCLNCPYNAKGLDKSVIEKVTDSWMMGLTKDRETKYDNALLFCQKCGGCPLKAKIWISQEVLEATTPASTDVKLKQPIVGTNGNTFLCWARKRAISG